MCRCTVSIQDRHVPLVLSTYTSISTRSWHSCTSLLSALNSQQGIGQLVPDVYTTPLPGKVEPMQHEYIHTYPLTQSNHNGLHTYRHAFRVYWISWSTNLVKSRGSWVYTYMTLVNSTPRLVNTNLVSQNLCSRGSLFSPVPLLLQHPHLHLQE